MIQEKTIKTKFGEFHYYDGGGIGKVIIYFPGWLANLDIINDLVGYFKPYGYRVILPVPPGHGDSFPIPRTFSFNDLVETMLEFIDKLGLESINIVGFSLGGATAWEIVRRRKARINKLILIDPCFDSLILSNFIKIVPKFLFYATWDKFLSMFNKKKLNFKHKILKTKGPNHLSIIKFIHEINTIKVSSWDQIEIPTLILYGENDNLVPSERILKLMKLPKNTKILKFKGGHFWFLRFEKKFFPIILDFLENS